MNQLQHIICFLISLCWINYATAQQADSSNKKIRLDISGGFYHQIARYSGDKAKEIKLPAYLSARRPYEPELAERWELNNNLATDNPLGHGASFLRFHSWYTITPGLDIYGSLEVNNGGFSWGPNNTFNTTILPRYNVSYNKSFGKGKKPFTFYGIVGNRESFKNYEGLTLYNIDVQSLEAGIQHGKLKVSAFQIADLNQGIGLGIDGLSDYKISLEQLNVNSRLKADIRAGIQTLVGSSDTKQFFDFASFSAAFYSSTHRLYTEVGYRQLADSISPASDNIALLAGISGKQQSRYFDLGYTVEFRHYRYGFNYHLHNQSGTHYRDTERGSGGNFIGNQVYPVSYADRPFSQWAVFTEYDQKQWVSGLIINLNANIKLGKHINWLAETDFNLIDAAGEETFIYPFFKTGLKVDAVKGTYLAATLTNKTMNMDKHYTTYYLLKNAVFQLEFRRDINFKR